MSIPIRRLSAVALIGGLLLAGATSVAYAGGFTSGGSDVHRIDHDRTVADRNFRLADENALGFGHMDLLFARTGNVTITITRVDANTLSVRTDNGRILTISASGLDMISGNMLPLSSLAVGDRLVVKVHRLSDGVFEVSVTSATPSPATTAAPLAKASAPVGGSALVKGQTLRFFALVGRVRSVSGKVVTIVESNGMSKKIDLATAGNSGLMVGSTVVAIGKTDHFPFAATAVRVLPSAVFGTVTSVSGSSFQIRTLAGKMITVDLTSATRFFGLKINGLELATGKSMVGEERADNARSLSIAFTAVAKPVVGDHVVVLGTLASGNVLDANFVVVIPMRSAAEAPSASPSMTPKPVSTPTPTPVATATP